jgi:hypothetical protein
MTAREGPNMTRSVRGVLAALSASTTLGALLITGVSTASAATRAGQQEGSPLAAGQTAADSGAQVWVQRYNGTGNGEDVAESVAVGPGGVRVFVTGRSAGTRSTGESDYATAAHNAATGARLWLARYNGPGSGFDEARAVAVSPGGATVFVTGTSRGTTPSGDYATIAYNASTGARRWVARYNGPAKSRDEASAVAVSPDGATVYVTGTSMGTSGRTYPEDYATIAYNAATGHRLWVARYNGPGNGYDQANSVTIGPGGGRVYVTGTSMGTASHMDFATIAYRAATGAWLWVRRYNDPANGDDVAAKVVASPDGKTVFVAGRGDYQYATVAYSVATGAQQWARRYAGKGGDFVSSMAIGPHSGSVYVTGSTGGDNAGADYATVAYGAVTGNTLWVKLYNGPGNGADFASSVAVGPNGGTVYVTGSSHGTASAADYATIAYNTATGVQRWASRYNGPANGDDGANSVAVGADGGRIFVTGVSAGTTSSSDYATVAYSG